MLGALAYAVYKILTKLPNQKGSIPAFVATTVLPGLFSGALAGLLAYLLAQWNVLGIKVDTTEVQGFIILGFLFSYVGIDSIVKAIAPRTDGSGQPSDNSAANNPKSQDAGTAAKLPGLGSATPDAAHGD
jgi:hypothetical protein